MRLKLPITIVELFETKSEVFTRNLRTNGSLQKNLSISIREDMELKSFPGKMLTFRT